MISSQMRERVRRIVSKHPAGRDSLIPILQDIQDEGGYLSTEAVGELSRQMGISENEVYGVGTFYDQFRFTPPGEHSIAVCQGTACHVRGGHAILAEFQQRLGIKAGETTKDGKFELRRVACIGCCALAPTVVVDGKVHARMTPRKVRPILDAAAGERGSRTS